MAVWTEGIGVTGAVGLGDGRIVGRICDKAGVAVSGEFTISDGVTDRRFDPAVTLGEDQAGTITGGNGDDTIQGGAGSDLLSGHADNDASGAITIAPASGPAARGGVFANSDSLGLKGSLFDLGTLANRFPF